MTNSVTVDSLNRVYGKLRQILPVISAGESPADLVGGLLLTALLIEKQREWNNPEPHRQAVLDLVGRLYDLVDTTKLKEETEHAAV